jgi:hypothetical protein
MEQNFSEEPEVAKPVTKFRTCLELGVWSQALTKPFQSANIQ